MRYKTSLWAGALLLLALSASLSGQTITATVTGLVADPSGASVADAKITATNAATNFSSTTQSNAAGTYTLLFLPSGTYNLTAEAAGFKKLSLGPIRLEVNQTARLDLKLEVGEITQSVEITDVAPVLQTESTTTGGVIDSGKLTNLPLNGRNFASLTILIPGAITTSPNGMNTAGRFQGGGSRPVVNGNREQTNNFIVEGIDTNDSIDNRIGYQPNVDALEEVNVLTGNAAAEFGNVGGGIVNATVKSGTNEFHGKALWFMRDEQLDANGYFGNRTPPPGGGKAIRREFRRDIFGGVFGGPIKKDKLFFFLDYEGTRQKDSGRAFGSVLPEEMRRGDLSRFTQVIRDPLNNNAPFAGNIIPTSRITNPAALALFADTTLYPLPNTTGTGPLGISNNYQGTSRNELKNDQADVKVDYLLSDKDRVSGTWSIGRYRTAPSEVALPFQLPGGTEGPTTFSVLNWNRTISPTVINEARFGYSRVVISDVVVDVAGQLGLDGNQKLGIPGGQPIAGASLVTIGDGFTSPGSAASISNTVDNKFQFFDNLTIQRGRHFIKTGGNIIRYQQNRFYPGNNGVLGRFDYTNRHTGVSTADFLLNTLSSKGRGSVTGKWGHRHSRIGLFVQDDWKLLPNFTLNLGMRYEYVQPLYEVADRQANIDLVTGELRLAGQNGNSRSLYNNYPWSFMPRIGFAWQVMPRLVVRSGYAISTFMEGTGANLRLTLNPPFFFESDVTYAPGSPGDIRTGFVDVQPQGGGQPVGQVRAWNPDLRPQFTQQWNFAIEYQLNNATSFTAAYVGQKGTHLVAPREFNQPLADPGPVSTWRPIDQRRPLYSVAPLITNISGTDSSATMDYHSLQMTMRRQLASGVTFISSYTLSKSLTDNSGYYGTPGVSGEGAYWANAYDRRGNRGLAFFDATHNFTWGGSYDLPFGRGRKFGSNMNRAADLIMGGWTFSSIVQLRTGFPFTVRGRDQTGQAVRGGVRADRLGSFSVNDSDRTIDAWFGIQCRGGGTPCPYADPAPGTFGNAGIGTERAPSFANWDASIGKIFNITERQHIDFRAEFFNFTNHVNWGAPAQTINAQNFGTIGSQANNPRNIQFGLKYVF
ncbi:MAG: TonB-dependent receptor [Bryobacteraceae bacterium]